MAWISSEEAREVVWNDAIKPKDAVHVATALRVHNDALLDQFDMRASARRETNFEMRSLAPTKRRSRT